ncbi:hypothetical protein B0H14DRAFT_3467819 [Mycena olivaceomarginata]|nr:hypothetical protein B0H14DRAFT_3467819 [Mycena olivaceomarginata]
MRALPRFVGIKSRRFLPAPRPCPPCSHRALLPLRPLSQLTSMSLLALPSMPRPAPAVPRSRRAPLPPRLLPPRHAPATHPHRRNVYLSAFLPPVREQGRAAPMLPPVPAPAPPAASQ